MVLPFIEHAEHLRWAQNVRNLQLNIFILDFNPFIKGVFVAEQFLEISKILVCSKKYGSYWKSDFFDKKVLKTRW